MIYVFIDTNIWYSIFSASESMLQQLENKWDSQELTFISSPILNREISKHHKSFISNNKSNNKSDKENISLIIPILNKAYPSVKEDIKNIQNSIEELTKKHKEKENRRLEILDRVINKHKQIASSLYTESQEKDILQRAIERVQLDYSPKHSDKDNYADPINWIALQEFMKNNNKQTNTVYFFTKDGDFIKSKLSLEKEWKQKCACELIFEISTKNLWDLLNIDTSQRDEEDNAQEELKQTFENIKNRSEQTSNNAGTMAILTLGAGLAYFLYKLFNNDNDNDNDNII